LKEKSLIVVVAVQMRMIDVGLDNTAAKRN
jgi:hypothetical protein